MASIPVLQGAGDHAAAVRSDVDALRAAIEDTRGAIRDPARLEQLRATGLLERHHEPAFDRITTLTQRVLDVPVATVSLVDEDFQHLLGRVGPPVPVPPELRSPLAYSFCQYAVETGERLVIRDARVTPLLQESPAVHERDVVSYAGEPLETESGHVLGTLCAMGDRPRAWSDADLESLRDLAAVATSEIEYRLRMRRMGRIETLVRELHDPVELLGDAIRSLAATVDRDASLPRAGRLAGLASSRLHGVETLERELQEAVRQHQRASSPGSRVAFAERVERAVRVATVAARPGAVELDAADVPVVVRGDHHLLERALSHLVVTALNHADDSRAVRVTLGPAEARAARLDVSSPGAGMPVADLASVVSRLHAALAVPGEPASARSGAGGAAIRLVGGRTVAQAGPVRATNGPDGTRVTVSLPLDPGPG